MKAPGSPLNPMLLMIDEVMRLGTRLQSLFAGARSATRLAPMEAMVLSAVVQASVPPTVPQIGRSLGHARQVVQRATKALIENGLVEPRSNPDHKRAPLLVATPEGRAIKALIDSRAVAAANELLRIIDAEQATRLTDELRVLRHQIEDHLRARDPQHGPDDDGEQDA